jgi:hypothetical protein
MCWLASISADALLIGRRRIPRSRPLYNRNTRTAPVRLRSIYMATTLASHTGIPGPLRVNVRRAAPLARWFGRAVGPADLQADLRRARWLANWLDSKFEVAGVRFGMEGIVGLIPVVGDLLGALAGLYPIYVARRHRLGRWLQARMAWNLFIEWLIGCVPFVGDAFDIAFKANLRNVRLLEKNCGRGNAE